MDVNDAFGISWNDYEEQTKMLLRMNESILNLDLVHPPMIVDPKDGSIRPVGMDKAIELLEACSEDLFITNEDKALEAQVDSFLKEHSKDNGHYIGLDRAKKCKSPDCNYECIECDGAPLTLKNQVD